MKQVYLAVGPYTWGKANDIETAINNAKVNWSKAYAGKFNRKRITVYLFIIEDNVPEADIYIDSSGMITWPQKVQRIILQLYPEE